MLTSMLLSALAPAAAELRLVRVAEYVAGSGHGAEIVSVQAGTARAVLLDADDGEVDLLDLAEPTAPKRTARHALALQPGEQATSIAFHPREDWFLVAVQGSGVWTTGRVEARDARTGARLGSYPCGVGPDSVVFDATGRRAAVACEGEGYQFDAATRTFHSPAGSISVLDFAAGLAQATSTTLTLPGFDGVPGVVVESDGRFLERSVDWNGNGRIDAQADFDLDGHVGEKPDLGTGDSPADEWVLVGTYEGRPVRARERDGETFELPLAGAPASAVEPECLSFSPDGTRVFAALQEVNAWAVVDVGRSLLVARQGFGLARHAADLRKDGKVAFVDELVALREPDGVALTPDGRFLVTADEGDSGPKASRVRAPGRAGGGRTLSVFDAATGAWIGDTGDQIDLVAHAAGLYPDERSDNKGSEPEMLVVFDHAGRAYAAVGLERAGGVALVDLGDPARPRVLGVSACGADAAASRGCQPEGLAVHRRTNGELYVLAANEGTGTLTVFALRADGQ